MEHRDRENWPLLLIGIVLMLAGAWVVLGRVVGYPALEPIRFAFDIVRRIAVPVLLVVAGVLIILFATRREMFTRTDGRRLYRSRDKRVVSGVLGGIAEYFGWDVALVRILFVLLAILTGGWTALVAYIIAAIAIPEEPKAVAPPEAPPAAPSQMVYTPPPTQPAAPRPPYPQAPYPPSTPPAPPQPSGPPTSPSVPEIPAPGIPVPPGQAYPPQAQAEPETELPEPPEPPAPAEPPAPTEPPAEPPADA